MPNPFSQRSCQIRLFVLGTVILALGLGGCASGPMGHVSVQDLPGDVRDQWRAVHVVMPADTSDRSIFQVRKALIAELESRGFNCVGEDEYADGFVWWSRKENTTTTYRSGYHTGGQYSVYVPPSTSKSTTISYTVRMIDDQELADADWYYQNADAEWEGSISSGSLGVVANASAAFMNLLADFPDPRPEIKPRRTLYTLEQRPLVYAPSGEPRPVPLEESDLEVAESGTPQSTDQVTDAGG